MAQHQPVPAAAAVRPEAEEARCQFKTYSQTEFNSHYLGGFKGICPEKNSRVHPKLSLHVTRLGKIPLGAVHHAVMPQHTVSATNLTSMFHLMFYLDSLKPVAFKLSRTLLRLGLPYLLPNLTCFFFPHSNCTPTLHLSMQYAKVQGHSENL